MAKVPSVVAEEDPSRKRKADEVAAPADSDKKAKGDDVVTVSDDTTVAPSGPPTATKAAVKTKEDASLGASTATFPRFMAKAATASGTTPSSHAPGVAETEVEQHRGHTPALLASVDALQLHGMLGAAIQVCPVPEDRATEFQWSDSFCCLCFFVTPSPQVPSR